MRWAYARGQDLKGSKQVKDHHHAGPRFGLPWCTHDGIPSHSHARSQQRQHNKVLLLLFHFRFFLPTHIHLFIRRHRKRQHQHPHHHSHPSSPPPSRPPPLPRMWPDGDEERERWVCVRACGIGSIPLLFLFYCPLCGNGRMSDWAVGIHWVHVLLCLRLSLLLHLHVSLFLRDGLMDGHTPHKYVYIHTTRLPVSLSHLLSDSVSLSVSVSVSLSLFATRRAALLAPSWPRQATTTTTTQEAQPSPLPFPFPFPHLLLPS